MSILWDLQPMFSSMIFMVWGLSFKSSIHFEFILVCGVRRWSSLIFQHVSVQFSQHHLLNKLPLAHYVVASSVQYSSDSFLFLVFRHRWQWWPQTVDRKGGFRDWWQWDRPHSGDAWKTLERLTVLPWLVTHQALWSLPSVQIWFLSSCLHWTPSPHPTTVKLSPFSGSLFEQHMDAGPRAALPQPEREQ